MNTMAWGSTSPASNGIVAGLVGIFAEAMKTSPEGLSTSADLSEIGVDSLVLFDVFGPIKQKFGVGLSIRDVSTRYRTIDSIAAYIGGLTSPPPAVGPAIAPGATGPARAPVTPVAPATGPATARVAPAAGPATAPVASAAPAAGPATAPVASAVGLVVAGGRAAPPPAPSVIVGEPLEHPFVIESARARRGALRPDAARGPGERAARRADAQGLHGVIHAQLDLMTLQLELMAGASGDEGFAAGEGEGGGGARWAAPHAPLPAAGGAPAGGQAEAPAGDEGEEGISYLNLRSAPELRADAARRAYVAGFVERYNRKTRGSKALAQRFRARVADVRNAIGFTQEIKELNYPIAAERMKGARAWDVDGNEYVDMTLGFGTYLLGHDPDGLAEAVSAAGALGVGLRTELALEAAELLLELTGMDRVLFVNDGTEAVMSAVKAARARTGRRKVIIFDASYHGHWDGVLAHRRSAGTPGDPDVARPMVRGVTPGAVADTVVFPFGGDEVFAYLAARGREVAAVLIEPIPLRDPGLVAPAFLAKLREAATQAGALLIFDELVTGFRCHPGGVQARFGVAADLATYGKVAGGGFPLGAVAGRGDSLDAIDGGAWAFGDDSFPAADTTMVGGTFFQHPASMAAACFVLRALRALGPGLQERVDRRAEALVGGLNEIFRSAGVAMEARGFSSFFRVFAKKGAELFYYNLIDRGVYIWEWRSWFLSDAHRQEEIDLVLAAVRESVAELQRQGLL